MRGPLDLINDTVMLDAEIKPHVQRWYRERDEGPEYTFVYLMFDVCELLYWNRDRPTPERWGFKPGIYAPSDEEDHPHKWEMDELLTTEGLIKLGDFLHEAHAWYRED